MSFSIIVAHDLNRGFGNNGKLPWPKLTKDMHHFSRLTSSKHLFVNILPVVIMGFKTWESLSGPLPDRLNIVVDTKTLKNTQKLNVKNVLKFVSSLEEALEFCNPKKDCFNHNRIYVIGGESLYKEAIEHPGCVAIYVTKIFKKFNCDRYFPPYEHLFKLDDYFSRQIHKQDDIVYQITYLTKIKKKHDEKQYLSLCQEILDFGNNFYLFFFEYLLIKIIFIIAFFEKNRNLSWRSHRNRNPFFIWKTDTVEFTWWKFSIIDNKTCILAWHC